MKKRTVTKLLSCMLAFSMVATAAPVTAWADEVPAAEEELEDAGEQPVVDDEEEAAVQEDTEKVQEDIKEDAVVEEAAVEEAADATEMVAAPEEDKARAVPSDGVADEWTQDPVTVKGDDTVFEKTQFLHIQSGSANGNDPTNEAGYPALFVNPNTFDFTKDGYFEYVIWPMENATHTRFGIRFGYENPGKGLFIGYNGDGWYWQKYGVDGNPWSNNVKESLPVKGKWNDRVRIDWTADGKFSLTVGEQKIFEDVSCDMELGAEGKIAVSCGTWGSARTHVYLKGIYYSGQEATEEGKHITGTVADEDGNPISGAQIAAGRWKTETGEDGTYDLEVPTGSYSLAVTKAGYFDTTVDVDMSEIESIEKNLVLYSKTVANTRTLTTDKMDVKVAENFPSIVQYDMKGDLAGKTFFGQPQSIKVIKINGQPIGVGKDDVKASFTENTATYEIKLKDETVNVDCVLTAVITAEGNTASFDITKVKNNMTEVDDNGYALYPVQSIEIPNHNLLSVNSGQQNAHLKGAKMSSNTRISGDRAFDVVKDMTLTNGASTEDFMYAFVSNSEMSAGLWSNSENSGTNVAAYIGQGGADNTRVIASAVTEGDVATLGLSSAKWYYDRRVSTPVVVGSDNKGNSTTEERTYVVGHDIMPSAKVVITGDENRDGGIDWQDGAVAFRSIMHNPYKSEEVPELVNYRIAMNFGSQAANPFLMNLDGVKRVYLNTEGLGQGVLLKGYGSEGHDSGHPDYGDIGSRIGGADDMNTLLIEGKKMGALFGVHVNASEMYTEAKAFCDELSRGYSGMSVGWNWLDQGIGINARYDLATKSRENRFKELHAQVGENLDFIYVDVWGNGVNNSGGGGDNSYEDAWASRMLAREINRLGWRMTTEWGPTQEYDSTLQHWAADLEYGGYGAKGENSEVMRFLRNHQKDSWVADYPSYGGAAQAPLLGGLNMTDFEGWQGRTNYKNYITVMFRHNLITKFLQHYQVVDWKDAEEAVTLPTGESWLPEKEITLRNTKDAADNTELVVTRDSTNYENLAEYRSRTITLNGVKISEGAPTGGDGTNPGDETYLIPWNWDCNGKTLAADDQKLYHWNTNGGTTEWTLTKDWTGLSSVVLYKLTDEGKTDKKEIPVVDGKITLTDIEAEIPYVIYKGEKEPLKVDWQTTKYVYDTGFNDTDVNSHRTVSGTGTASIVDNAVANNMLKLEGEVSVSTKLTNLKKGQKYALYVGVDNRSDAKAHVTVKYGKKVLGSNYATRSFAQNYVASDQHHTSYWRHTDVGTVSGTDDKSSCFQNMYVFFTAEGGTATLSFDREAGEGATYFDDIRVVETTMDPIVKTDENGNPTELFNDFEDNAQGIWPFVISDTENVEDNRIHLSERHGKYTQAGFMSKQIDDVLDGNWSVKVNGLAQRNNLIYQTIPQNFRFEPGETYQVSFDYQMGGDRVYELRLGDGTNRNVKSWDMSAAIGKTKRFSTTFTAGESGNNWIGIFSTSNAPQTGGYKGNIFNFAGYADFVLDNLRIEKVEKGTGISLKETYVVGNSEKVTEPIQLEVEFPEGVDKNTDVVWTSLDEDVALVDSNGFVRFVEFGSAGIRATATINGKKVTADAIVYLEEIYSSRNEAKNVWVNTEETASESGSARNAFDGNSSTIWHSQYSPTKFTVSEENPAIITVEYAQDVTAFDTLGIMQRGGGGVNGVVKKYKVIVGNGIDEAGAITDVTYASDVITSQKTGSGETELFEVPKDVKGTFLQIQVLEGHGGFAAMAEVLGETVLSYRTPEAEAAMKSYEEQMTENKEVTNVAQNDLKETLTEMEEIYAGGESFYSAESWAAFEAAYNQALALENSSNLTRLQEVKLALEKAKKKLVELSETEKRLEVGLKALNAALEIAKPVYDNGKNGYSQATWETFKDAYEEAKASLNSADADKVETMKEYLVKAQDSLKSPSETEKKIEAAQEKLKASISKAKAAYDAGKSKYTQASWETFEEAYVEANNGVKSVGISKLERLTSQLDNAFKGLEKTLANGDKITINNVQYKVTNAAKKTAVVVKGTKKSVTSVTIPATITIKGVTCNVTSIEAKAFNKFTKLKKVTIGDNVTAIKASSFEGCSALTEVVFGKKVANIGKKAFYNCKKLAKVQYLATGIKKIDTQAFKNTSAKMKVTLPKGTAAKKRNSIKTMMTKAGMNKKATVK